MKILTFKIYTGITSFILSDCMEAFRELGHTVETLVLPESGVVSKRDFIQKLASINPDFIFTVNHLGIAGPLYTLMEIPCAS